MKLFAIAALAATLVQVEAAPVDWLTDLPKGQAEAKAKNKFVVMDFTGSDWCPACIMLEKNVFDTPSFQTYAASNFVLVRVDLPRGKSQPAELKAANQALAEKFKIQYLPTVIVMDSSGKLLGQQEGYDGESPKEFIQKLEKMEKAGK